MLSLKNGVLFCFIFLCSVCLVQGQNIEGTVTDAKTGETLPGVNILVKGTTTGTSTDAKGHFELSVESLQDTLVATFVGYQSKEISINGQQEFDIKLNPEAIKGEEVVVVGYGTEKKESLTSSVGTVQAETMERLPTANLTNTLAGQEAGITAINTSGEPGSQGSTIRIRGNHSLNANDPLIVIDGVPDRSGEFNSLTPGDIENVSILKGPDAAIYGSEAANGVILVTTKSGNKDQAPELTVKFDKGFNQPTRVPELTGAQTYMRMLNEINKYNGSSPAYSQEEIQKYNDPDRDRWLYPDTDWFDEALKPLSNQMKGDVSVQGGTSDLTYYLSLGGRTKDGYYRNSATKYNQLNLRSNIGVQVSESFKATFNISGRWEDRNWPTESAFTTFQALMLQGPNEPAYYPNGLPGPGLEHGWNPVVTGTDQTGYNHKQQYYFKGIGTLEFTPPAIDGLNIKGTLSYSKDFTDQKTWEQPWTLYNFNKAAYKSGGKKDPEKYLEGAEKGPSDPRLTKNYGQQYTILANVTANYSLNFKDHNLDLMLGTEERIFKTSNFNAFRRHYVSGEIQQLFAGSETDWSNDGSAAHGAKLGFFGRTNYNYKSKYLINLVARYDGSYLFPSGERFGFFPSISVGWDLANESFFNKKVGLFDELKLRASWGINGNDRTTGSFVENRQYLATYQFGGGYVFGAENQNKVKSIYQSTVPNPNITWEKAKKFGVGLDGALFKNQLSFTFDYYHELRSDILIQRNASVPLSTGLNLPRENLGKVKSWGYEGTVMWDQQVNKDFTYGINFNVGYNNNKIVYWDEPPGAPPYQKSTGHRMNTGLYYKATGIFQDEEEVENTPHWTGARPGDIIYKDVNNDGQIDGDDRIRIDKNNMPKWTGGITFNANYKNFDASVFFQGASGAILHVSTKSGFIGNYLEDFSKKRWRPDPNAENDPRGVIPDPNGAPFKGPRAYDRDDEYWSPLSKSSTYFLRSTDYIRLKNVQLGYSLPENLLAKVGIKKLRVYISGFNLLTWDKLKVMDPEASDSGGRYYPQSRIYNLGLSLKF